MKRLLSLLLFIPCMMLSSLAMAQGKSGFAIGKANLGGVYLTNGLVSLCLECGDAPRSARFDGGHATTDRLQPRAVNAGLFEPRPVTLQVRMAF